MSHNEEIQSQENIKLDSQKGHLMWKTHKRQ